MLLYSTQRSRCSNYLATWTLTEGYNAGRTARSSHQTFVPFGNFPTKDGWLVVGGVKEKFWQRLADGHRARGPSCG